MDRREIVDLVYDSPVSVARLIGYDKLTGLHDDWIRRMTFGDDDETVQGHRGSYKTTCLGISFANILTFFPWERTIFMRKTDTDVAEVMKATANVLSSGHYRFLANELYGHPLDITVGTQSAVSTNLALGVSGSPQLLGLGCGASLTGKHADNVFTDDIVNIKDRVSAAERERIKLTFQELQNIKNRGGRIFNTGTPWHKDDAFSLMPNIMRFDCYSTGLMTREEIAHVRGSMTPSLFAANYELKHIADETAMFKEPSFFGDPRLLHDGIGHVDAAYGGEDSTAFTAARRIGDEYYLFGRLWPKHVDDCIDEILELHSELRLGTIHCESNADKGYLAKKLRKLGAPCSDYPESTNKYIKISTYLRAAWPRVRFLDCPEYELDAEYLSQILDYSENAAHDDAPDSGASVIRQLDGSPRLNILKGRL